ncbi:septal ring lytic transglycosylase RlpA family protein [uncultured Brevundimonas sp.]|uniref:septal ring lytic transglycosylase RlpA family protein n=1 Tax=uncultured Brevundimonas sp. TaxID=213418 RepID=UPI0030ED1F03|tara:strand:- start:72335 stop:73171 length:837 start_codon:yes stop_codon:yes gene_type:complete
MKPAPTAMTTRMLKGALILGLMSLLAACASGGVRDGGYAAAARMPVVTDPAPIVSGTMRPYQIRGQWYRPVEDPNYDVTGLASWYGDQFNGRPTATGEIFDMHALTAAHKTLPLPGLVEVTNLANGRSVVLRVNDRGPFVDNRVIDLSRGAAEELDLLSRGVGQVRVRYLGRAPRQGGGMRLQTASAAAPVRAEAPAPAPVYGGTAYWIQAGAYANRRTAQRIARRLGDTAAVDEVRTSQGTLYRVLVGPWNDANAAERARQAILARGIDDALLISAS